MVLPTEKNEVPQQLPISEDRRAMQINNKSKSNTLNSQHNDNHNSSSPEKMTVIAMVTDALSLHNLTPKDMGTLISEYIHGPRVPVRVLVVNPLSWYVHSLTLTVLGIAFLLFVISVTGFFVMWFTEYYNNTMLQVRRGLWYSSDNYLLVFI